MPAPLGIAASVNEGDALGRTPLWLAASKRHVEIVSQLLVVPRIDVNEPDKRGRTPLWEAASNEYIEIAPAASGVRDRCQYVKQQGIHTSLDSSFLRKRWSDEPITCSAKDRCQYKR